MAVKFDRNCYFHANKEAVLEVKSQIEFQYGNVTKISFNAQYDLHHENQRQIQRKFTALPSALMTLARMVANLAYAAIVGLPSLIMGNTKPLKFGLFRFVRNGEILAGRLISIFNDRLGLYHVQKGQFHKACYALSMQKSRKNKSWEDDVHLKAEPLIKKHYDKNNIGLVSQEIKKTFLKPNEKKLAFTDLLEYAIQQKDVDSVKKIKQIEPLLFSKEDLKIAKARIRLEMGHPEEAVKLLRYIVLRNHDSNTILQRCAAIFYERGDLNKAIEALDAMSGEQKLKDKARIELGEKCIQNNQLEAAREIASKFYIYKDGYPEFLAHLLDKYLENKKYEAAFDCAIERLAYDRKVPFYLKIAHLLLKDPSKESLLFEICTAYHTLNLRENCLISVAAELLQSNDPEGAKHAVVLCFKNELIIRHFVYHEPNAAETQRINDLSLKLGESSFLEIKNLLDKNQKEAAFKKVKQIIRECQESPKDPEPQQNHYHHAQPGIDPQNFFNNFFNGAHFNQGNPFAQGFNFYGNPFGNGFNHQGFNFNGAADRNLPREVAKLNRLEIPPKAPILVEYYEKCLKAEPKNYHQIIGLGESYTADELKKASRNILLKIHPDKHPEEREAANEITGVITCIRKSLEEWVSVPH